MTDMIKFDLPKNLSSIIKVMGVGGGGSNAVSNMYNEGIKGVDFIICNTDAQALDASSVPTKIQLGNTGLGAGSIPSVGREAALEKKEEISKLLEKDTHMIFITAGMGGGTGTGAAPVIAEMAKELGILTVGIVTMPFSFEGRKRQMQAEEGMEELKKHVDTLLVIVNDKLRILHGNLKLSEAFKKADTVLTTAAKGIAELITVTGYINVDFEDVKTVMKGSGKAIMGSACAEGDDRADKAIKEALESPLLNDNNIDGASNILLYISSGDDEISMDEVDTITNFIQTEAGPSADIIWGKGTDTSLGDKISITLIATGFSSEQNKDKIVYALDSQKKGPINTLEPNASNSEPKIELVDKDQNSKNPQGQKPENNPEATKTVVFDLATGKEQPKTEDSSSKIIEPTLIKKEEPEADKNKNLNANPTTTSTPSPKELEKIAQGRINRLKNLSLNLRSSKTLSDLENEPAYLRRNVKLSETPSSSESHVSKYSLNDKTDDESNSSPLKKNNKYLHDKPD
jgi:cell division protein FtsZ